MVILKGDIDSIIYIIVTLIFVALGALGRKKPKKPSALSPEIQNDNSESDQERQQDAADMISENFKRIFGDFGQYNDQTSVITGQHGINVEPEEEIIVVEDEKPGTYEDALDTVEGAIDNAKEAIDNTEEAFMLEAEELFIEDQIKMSELGGQESAVPYYHDIDRILKNFNGRKAIIYSEIINPKYF